MIRGLIRFILKVLIQYVVWVVILSFSWNGKTLFERSKPYIFENKIAQVVKKKATGLWNSVYDSVPDSLKNFIENKLKKREGTMEKVIRKLR